MVTFIGLNPSTADEASNDQTTRRCIGFARSWGYSRMNLVNVYAFRATNPPTRSRRLTISVGPDNQEVIQEILLISNLVICAWGTFGAGPNADDVRALVSAPHCLGRTRLGAPRHPLYVNARTTPTPFR